MIFTYRSRNLRSGFFRYRPSEFAVPHLIHWCNDNHEVVCERAIHALGAIEGNDNQAIIVSKLKSPSASVRRAAFEVLLRKYRNGEYLTFFQGEGYPRWIDPAEPVSADEIRSASERTGLSIADALDRYQEIAQKFGLTFAKDVAAM